MNTEPNARFEKARAALQDLLTGYGERPLLERFPAELDGKDLSAGEIIDLLSPFLTAARQERIRSVVSARTYALLPVVEGLINVGNVSAVMRTAEALGCQEMQVVTTGEKRFKQSERTSQGAEKWLDLKRWPGPEECVADLHRRGYHVVAMHLDEDAVPIEEVDFTRRTALVFGNEAKGVSDQMVKASDRQCIIPLPGFTQSFNVSVAAAVSLYHARQERLRRQGHHADLTEREREALTADFYLRSIGDRAEQLLRRVAPDSGHS